MNMLRWIGMLACGFALTLQGVAADKKKSTAVEKSNTGAVVSSETTEKKSARLSEQLTWHTSLEAAQSQARLENKPILWLHVLGDIDGIC